MTAKLDTPTLTQSPLLVWNFTILPMTIKKGVITQKEFEAKLKAKIEKTEGKKSYKMFNSSNNIHATLVKHS